MPHNPSAGLPAAIPDSFFAEPPQSGSADIPSRSESATLPAQTTITSDLHKQNRPNSHTPTKAMLWYDAIVDDMIANPGTTLKATAARLGRSPVTIGYIVNSDLFKARYAQRRDQFNEELDSRLIGKLAKVAELSLDLTLESLEKKRTSVPLPLLHDVSDKALSRLGYGPKPAGGSAAVAVTVNNQNNANAAAVSQVATPVSAEALASARENLRLLESGRAAAARPTGEALSRSGEAFLEPCSARESAAGGGGADGE